MERKEKKKRRKKSLTNNKVFFQPSQRDRELRCITKGTDDGKANNRILGKQMLYTAQVIVDG